MRVDVRVSVCAVLVAAVSACSPTEGVGRDAGEDVAPDFTQVQRRIEPSCAPGEAMSGVREDGTPQCALLGRGDIEAVAAGAGLAGGAEDGTAVVALRPCEPGQILRSTGADYVCSDEVQAEYLAGEGLRLVEGAFSVDPDYLAAAVGGPYLPLQGGTVGGPLTVLSSVPGGRGAGLSLRNTGGGSGASVGVEFSTFDSGAQNPSASLMAQDDSFSAHLVFRTRKPGSESNPLQERMRVSSGGNVGINQPSPARELDVGGTVRATRFEGPAAGLTGLVQAGGTARAVYGIVGSDGSIKAGSSGFSVTRTGQGEYDLHFSPAFIDYPVVTFTQAGGSFGTMVATDIGGPRVHVIAVTPSGARQDVMFSFIALGNN